MTPRRLVSCLLGVVTLFGGWDEWDSNPRGRSFVVNANPDAKRLYDDLLSNYNRYRLKTLDESYIEILNYFPCIQSYLG